MLVVLNPQRNSAQWKPATSTLQAAAQLCATLTTSSINQTWVSFVFSNNACGSRLSRQVVSLSSAPGARVWRYAAFYTVCHLTPHIITSSDIRRTPSLSLPTYFMHLAKMHSPNGSRYQPATVRLFTLPWPTELSQVNLVWIISGFSCQSSMLTHICPNKSATVFADQQEQASKNEPF